MSSQSIANKSSVEREYVKCILFSWRPGLKTPFAIFPRENFGPTEIRDVWYKFQLKPEYRIRILKALASFPGENWSLFAKVEKGFFYQFNCLNDSMSIRILIIFRYAS